MLMVINLKKILIYLIKLYQKIPGAFHDMCRHTPSCSNYAIEALQKHGTLKGSYLSIKRILRCNPFGSFGYDPVPSSRRKNEK